MLFVLFLVLGGLAFAKDISLAPADPASLEAWAQVAQVVRLYPTPRSTVRYEGPTLALHLWGEVALGKARYPFLLGVTPKSEVGLWLDQNRDGRVRDEEKVLGNSSSGVMLWAVSLTAEPQGGMAFSYPLQILWPGGVSYVLLGGGAPRAGTFMGRTLVFVDGDLDGVFGTERDFLGVDVDGDGKIYAEVDGHERFKITEVFTIEGQSFRVQRVSSDGLSLNLEPASYVSPKVPLIPGAPAPDFSFQNLLDGKALRLSQLRGKVVLLDFWATWCPPCLASLPELRELYEQYRPRGFEIVGISLDESATDLRRVRESYEINWPIAFFGKRWGNPVADLYRIYQIPTTYLLDKDGVIRFRGIKGEELRRAIEELLAEPRSAEDEEKEGASFAKLTISLPPQVKLPSQGTAQLPLILINEGDLPVEDVTVVWEALPGGVAGAAIPPFSLTSGEEREVVLSLSTENFDPRLFPARTTLDVTYRPAGSPTWETKKVQIELVLEEDVAGRRHYPWWILGFLALGVALVFFLLKSSGILLIPLFFVFGFLIDFG